MLFRILAPPCTVLLDSMVKEELVCEGRSEERQPGIGKQGKSPEWDLLGHQPVWQARAEKAISYERTGDDRGSGPRFFRLSVPVRWNSKGRVFF